MLCDDKATDDPFLFRHAHKHEFYEPVYLPVSLRDELCELESPLSGIANLFSSAGAVVAGWVSLSDLGAPLD